MMRTLMILLSAVLLVAVIHQATHDRRKPEKALVPIDFRTASALGTIHAGSSSSTPMEAAEQQSARTEPAPLGTVLAGGDRDEIANHLTPTAEFVDRDGHVIRGRQPIAKALASFQSRGPEGHTGAQMISLRIVESGLVIEDGFTTTTEGDDPHPIHTPYTAVEVLHDGKWYVASVREHAWTARSQPASINQVGATASELSAQVRGIPDRTK